LKNAKSKTDGMSFNVAAALDGISDPRRPKLLGEYSVERDAMLGVVRIGIEGTQGFWERHDGGDELLVVIAGSLTMTLRPEGAPDQTYDVGPGDALLIPKGVAHSGKLHTDEVRILFVTPREGNDAWTDHPDLVGRHGASFATGA